jgi:hypothetical protein
MNNTNPVEISIHAVSPVSITKNPFTFATRQFDASSAKGCRQVVS